MYFSRLYPPAKFLRFFEKMLNFSAEAADGPEFMTFYAKNIKMQKRSVIQQLTVLADIISEPLFGYHDAGRHGMKRSIYPILLAIFLLTGLTTYWLFRIPLLDNKICNSLSLRTAHSGKALTAFFEADENTQPMIRETLCSVLKRGKGAVISAVADNNGTLLFLEKNDSIMDLETYRIVAGILRDSEGTGPRLVSLSPFERYFVTWHAYSNSRMAIVYRFFYSPRTLLRIGIELLVLCALIVSVLFLFRAKTSAARGTMQLTQEYAVRLSAASNCLPGQELPEDFLEEILVSSEDNGKADMPKADMQGPYPQAVDFGTQHDERQASSELQNESIYSIFHQIMHRHNVDAISLYQLDRDSRALHKTNELSGQSFVRIPMENSFIRETQAEIIAALEAGSVVVLDRNKRVLLPVFFEGLFLGALALSNSTAIDGFTYGLVKKHCKDIGRAIMKTMLSSADNTAATPSISAQN